MNIKANEENVGKRIDSFIPMVQEDISRSMVQKIIEQKNKFKILKKSYLYFN